MEMLANRIERLRAEERKAKQKVLETKIRGQEIISLQRRNHEATAAKEVQKQVEAEARARETSDQQIRRAEHRAGLKATFEGMHTSKRDEVRLFSLVLLLNCLRLVKRSGASSTAPGSRLPLWACTPQSRRNIHIYILGICIYIYVNGCARTCAGACVSEWVCMCVG